MKALVQIGTVIANDGAKVVLFQRDEDFQIRVDGLELMNSRTHGSEEDLATLSVERLKNRTNPAVLIGGLGMGYTLRAALDVLPTEAKVVVAEFFEAVVEWNRGPLGPLAGRPLDDSRVVVRVEDVRELVRKDRPYDAIILDVDNGPSAFTVKRNQHLYSEHGLKMLFASLDPGGLLALWSSYPDPWFERRVSKVGFELETKRVRARGKKGPKHTLFFATKP